MLKCELELLFTSYLCCCCRTIVSRCTEVLRIVWGSLGLGRGDSYIITATILTQVINFIACTCCKLTRYFILKGCNLTGWGIRALLPCAVVVLYVDIVVSFPVEVAAVIIH